MPEFRRGWARFLPREAERDLFHPSLEDLHAEHVKGIRLQIATAALWLECWRVWLFNVDPPSRLRQGTCATTASLRSRPTEFPAARKDYVAMLCRMFVARCGCFDWNPVLPPLRC